MEYEYWLASILDLSDKKKMMIRTQMESAKAAYNIEETEWKQLSFLNDKDIDKIIRFKHIWNIKKEFENLQKQQIRIIYYYENDYPKRLLNISDPPYALYLKGSLPKENQKSAAIVGARKCTAYGEKSACEFAQKLAEHGVQIISGMAYGIDGIAHRGALFGGGKTFAVLGNGVDICYPRSHIGLYTDILSQGGGIISEFPPGTKPLPMHFPKRNRIISGLSDLVLVMEAKEKSGSLITADMALEQGKDVYALPGPIDSVLSKGCNSLIKQGAGILLSPENLMEEIGILNKKVQSEKAQNGNSEKKVLESIENLVYSTFAVCSKNVNEIIEETGLPPDMIMRSLAMLEIAGYIRMISKDHYIKC
ncbi:MAG: DNA-processing protein DprA [Schaedlerella sp.]|nr:DNA-processing protein DprA [Schaedlerella sp.]